MIEALQVIKNRRSIRHFQPEQISDHELQEILNAALLAPNAMNRQQWHFTVIQNQDVISKMVNTIKTNIVKSGNEFLAKRASSPNYHTFYQAPTVILISGEETAQSIQLDCGLAAENIALAAETLNIGSCIITSSGLMFASDQAEEFKRELGIPEGYSHVCTIALGYKASDNPATPPRKQEVINYIK